MKYGQDDLWVPVQLSIERLETVAKQHSNIKVAVVAGADHTMMLGVDPKDQVDPKFFPKEAPDAPAYFFSSRVASTTRVRAMTRRMGALFFGFVLIYIPARLFSVVAWPARIGRLQVAGIVMCATGAVIALWCVSNCAFIGRGTPAPFAAPRRLVTRGPYRFVRNPMYVAVRMFFVGAAVFYQSALFLAYAVLFFISSHLFVVLYEEPTLRRTFGDEYTAYCGRVRRWSPRLSPPPK